MKRRCYNPNWHGYHRCGGRGMTVGDRWLISYSNFLEDMGERHEGLTLDRIDVNKDYSPDNCKWSTRSEQAYNRELKTHCVNGHELTEDNIYIRPTPRLTNIGNERKSNRECLT